LKRERYEGQGRQHAIVTRRTRLRGLDELSLGDYQLGDRVEVRFRPSDGRVYELKLEL